MSFSTRRGRPPKPKPTKDHGTPELQAKRSHGLTTEAIDLCLERRLISPSQHWCGLHLRWLYTIRYGAPSLSSHWWQLLCEQHGPREETQGWRKAREEEYTEAREHLRKHRCYDAVMRICVYDETPCFLRPDVLQRALASPPLVERIDQERRALCAGLEQLQALWQQ